MAVAEEAATAPSLRHNIAHFLPAQAATTPDLPAVTVGIGRDTQGRVVYRTMTFADLDRESDAYAWGLSSYGIGRGTRVLLMVPAGMPLIALTFALFKIGCVPVLIDPAMGRQNLVECIKTSAPEALIGIERAHLARLLFPAAFRSVRIHVTVGRRLFWSGATLRELRADITTPFPLAEVRADERAAILFTTGSTGIPKGVVYEHGMFAAQCRMLQQQYAVEPGEIDMPAFPLFALFNVAMGVTSAIPPIDPTRPASCDPAAVIETLQDQQVTMSFGSPAIWNRIAPYALERGVTLPKLRRVLMAGAPVPLHLHEQFQQILGPAGDTHTPYGATEALPICSASGREILAAHAEHPAPTAGTCVGRPLPDITLRIIGITDDAILEWRDDLPLPPFAVGEIVVRGPTVTKEYINRPDATEKAKIRDGNAIWHRMGDLGYLDDAGRLWFYGRKTHRVETASGARYTEPVERVFNQHPAVFRSALVGVADGAFQRPVVLIEVRPGQANDAAAQARLVTELRSLARAHEMTADLDDIRFHPGFPVDIRHNAKIFREKLAVWAQEPANR